jgi:hypothetical protein
MFLHETSSERFLRYDADLETELSKSAHGTRVNQLVAQFFECVLQLCLNLPDELDDNQKVLLRWLFKKTGGTLVVVAPPYKLHFVRASHEVLFPIFTLRRVEYPN